MCLTPTAQATYFIVTLILMKKSAEHKKCDFYKGFQWETIWQRVALDLNNQSQM